MAVTAQLTYAGNQIKAWAITATSDTDTAIVIEHGMTSGIGFASLVPISNAARLSQWYYNANATQVILYKTQSVGSGNANPQLLVFVMSPHSIIK